VCRLSDSEDEDVAGDTRKNREAAMSGCGTVRLKGNDGRRLVDTGTHPGQLRESDASSTTVCPSAHSIVSSRDAPPAAVDLTRSDGSQA
jgi:hypothetical protein